ncbi:MAG TPA: LLM class flavin-dependent oxidoreductase [Polyangiaceae bacterium]|nr:LLM class flavin-dependent oxidoreductase [Polyangiaceae bacterium]
MSSQRRKLVLNVFFQRFGHHPEAWRHRGNRGSTGRPDVDFWVRLAQHAEKAKFDSFFLADFIGRSGEGLATQAARGGSYQFEPFTLLSAIAVLTRHIGLVATANTNFSHPYSIARQFTSLDHLSGGRAAWNVVSSFGDAPAKNFGVADGRTHSERYERAAEFVDLTKAYWDSWEDDAFSQPNPATAQFFDPRDAHPLAHEGKYFSSHGLLDMARPVQGYPVLVQAGNSETGREFAARVAEMTYCSAQTLDDAKAYYTDVKSRMAKFGRDPDQLKIAPGLSVVVGVSDQQAQDRFGELQELIDFSKGVNLGGTDLTGYDLDGPLPDLPESENGKGRFRQLVSLARRENLTIRQLVYRFSTSRGHLQVHGSAKTIADKLEEWFVERGADGFNVVPPLPPFEPGGFLSFANEVVPELQRRGLFRTEYEGQNLRENLGLRRPANQFTATRGSSRVEAEPLSATG